MLSLGLIHSAQAEKKHSSSAETSTSLAITVFREPGFALAEAQVSVAPASSETKMKPLTSTTGPRGESVVRLPAAASYTVRASAKGFISQEKTVSVQSGQRAEVTFLMAPESKR